MPSHAHLFQHAQQQVLQWLRGRHIWREGGRLALHHLEQLEHGVGPACTETQEESGQLVQEAPLHRYLQRLEQCVARFLALHGGGSSLTRGYGNAWPEPLRQQPVIRQSGDSVQPNRG